MPGKISTVDLVAVSFYFMHFVLPMAVGFLFWLRDRGHYWHFVSALFLMSGVAFLTYLVFPSTPPWLQFPGSIHKISNETVSKLDVDYFEALAAVIYVAAANAAVEMLARRQRRRRRCGTNPRRPPEY